MAVYKPAVHGLQHPWLLEGTEPKRPEPVSVPAGVATISPKFVTIMQQVAVAEANNLDQIVGMGLRKALEFLIKDYCSSRHTDKAEEIKKTLLGKCIETYVDEEKIQKCAKRATWLGNDETHYTRVWQTKDVGDLKTLIRLTVIWIESHLETEKFVGDMPER